VGVSRVHPADHAPWLTHMTSGTRCTCGGESRASRCANHARRMRSGREAVPQVGLKTHLCTQKPAFRVHLYGLTRAGYAAAAMLTECTLRITTVPGGKSALRSPLRHALNASRYKRRNSLTASAAAA
jgi:hypothetical protein